MCVGDITERKQMSDLHLYKYIMESNIDKLYDLFMNSDTNSEVIIKTITLLYHTKNEVLKVNIVKFSY